MVHTYGLTHINLVCEMLRAHCGSMDKCSASRSANPRSAANAQMYIPGF